MYKKKSEGQKKQESLFRSFRLGCFLSVLLFCMVPCNISAELLLDSTVGTLNSSYVTVDSQQMVIGEKTTFPDADGRPIPYVEVLASALVEAEYDYIDSSQTEPRTLTVKDLYYLRISSDYDKIDVVGSVASEPVNIELLYPTRIVVSY